MRRPLLRSLLVVPIVAITACSGEVPVAPSARPAPGAASLSVASAPESFVLDFTGALPASVDAAVAAAGGTVTSRMDEIGIVVATSSNPAFRGNAGRISGVRTVSPDLVRQWTSPIVGDEIEDAGVSAQANVIGSTETFRNAQWNVDAISAPSAWTAGYQGLGARVAVIDGGIHSSHIDLVGNIDVPRSRSFVVPATPFNQDIGPFWHGTHVAGIIAAKANNIGTVGVAPKATIIGVKALHNGSGAFSWIINAIYYAATPISEGGAGAHIINMSLGAGFQKNEDGAAALKNALSKATTYAYQRGVTVIAAAGNSATDIDHTGNLIFVPAQSTHVIAVSATGPLGFALGATNFDRPASYTNFGQSIIAFAGPGGDAALLGNAPCTVALIPSGSLTRPCWVFDMVLSTSRGSGASISSYSWAAGTSMASPAVAGVAALIVGKNGPISPSAVESALRRSADDLGKPGNDDFYGGGRVNALRAVQ